MKAEKAIEVDTRRTDVGMAARRALQDAETAPIHPEAAIGSLLSSIAWSLIRIGDLLERERDGDSR